MSKPIKTENKHDCPSCVAFGRHCPHKVNGDPYFYDCYLTVEKLEKENAELKARLNAINLLTSELGKSSKLKKQQLTKARHLIRRYVKIYVNPYPEEEIELRNEAEQFLKEVSE